MSECQRGGPQTHSFKFELAEVANPQIVFSNAKLPLQNLSYNALIASEAFRRNWNETLVFDLSQSR
jgi:hypothetical protein